MRSWTLTAVLFIFVIGAGNRMIAKHHVPVCRCVVCSPVSTHNCRAKKCVRRDKKPYTRKKVLRSFLVPKLVPCAPSGCIGLANRTQ